MSSQPEAAPTDGRQHTRPVREIAALVLVTVTAVLLFVAVLDLLIPYTLGGNDFTARARDSFFAFVGLSTIGFPLLAVLLATHLSPPVARARLITTMALVELAVAGVFGALFGLLIGVAVIADTTFRGAFEALLVRASWLAVLAVAGYAVFQVWRHQPRAAPPRPQGYGQPHPPQGYGPPPGQPGHPPQGYGQQPGYPPPNYGPQATAPGYAHPGYAQPGGYQSAPVSVPPAGPPPGAGYGPPGSGAPSSGPPAGYGQQPAAYPFGQYPPEQGAEPTRAVPVDEERTRTIDPASQQPAAGYRPPYDNSGDERDQHPR